MTARTDPTESNLLNPEYRRDRRYTDDGVSGRT
jgi:hypothetical protein